jgi:hypothetical protein
MSARLLKSRWHSQPLAKRHSRPVTFERPTARPPRMHEPHKASLMGLLVVTGPPLSIPTDTGGGHDQATCVPAIVRRPESPLSHVANLPWVP